MTIELKKCSKEKYISKKRNAFKMFYFSLMFKKNIGHCIISAKLFVEKERYLVRDECTDYKTIDYNLYSSFHSA